MTCLSFLDPLCDPARYGVESCPGFEKRRIHASIDSPRRNHQIVPRIPQVAIANGVRSSDVNITLNAQSEIGISATNTIRNGIRDGPFSKGGEELQ